MKKASYALSLIVHWIKSILYNWDALTYFLKTENKMQHHEVNNIKYLKKYLSLTHEPFHMALLTQSIELKHI